MQIVRYEPDARIANDRRLDEYLFDAVPNRHNRESGTEAFANIEATEHAGRKHHPPITMNLISLTAVGIGGALGAIGRWCLGLLLNPLFPTLPLGTLAANLAGGLLIGVAMGAFAHYETLPIAMRLAVTTGFLGGLTTFSTFSAETTTLFLRQQYAWMLTMVGVHVIGSLLMTLLGISVVRLFLRT